MTGRPGMPSSRSTFGRFAPRLQEAIVSRLGWSSLRPVQEQAGAAILDGHNAVVLAPTAGGKTEASMFPTLSMLVTREPEAVGALYLAPIKALLNNQADRLGRYTEMVGLDRFLWHGDVGSAARRAFIADPCALLMTTPESLEVMLASPRVPVARLFADLRIVIIDEIHALAGNDRGGHLMSVLERIADHSRHDVQRVGLSATVGNPAEILAWLNGTSARPGLVIAPPGQPSRRRLAVHLDPELSTLARRVADKARGHKSLLFCESRALTEIMADSIRGRGTEVFVHHSSVSLEERAHAEERFAGGGDAAIVCTSTLELGIDVGDLDLVLQTNAPATVSSFLQRMGRTGRRAGTAANTTFYCDNPESVLQAVALVELARSGWVESVPVQRRCWPVFVHQLLALTLERGGVPTSDAWRLLSRIPDVSGITRAEFDLVLAHMRTRDFLFETDGLLTMGRRAERIYGKKNFLELYAVFSSPVYYRVQLPGGSDIGYLEQGFVDRLVEQMSSFLLGGRAWLTRLVDHRNRVIKVQPAPRGRKPSWGGFAPKMLGFEVCQRIVDVLREDATYAYLSSSAMTAIEEYRDEFRGLLRDTGHEIRFDDERVYLYTFAGGRINHTLKYALEELTGWKVTADNFHVRCQSDGIGPHAVRDAVATISTPGFWHDLDVWQRIIARMPPYRFSKFQPALPAIFQQELIGQYLLDIEGTRRYLQVDGESTAPTLQAILATMTATGFATNTEPSSPTPPVVDATRPTRPIRLVAHQGELAQLCAQLASLEFVALDVETTLWERDLCLIQFGTTEESILIDPLAIEDLTPLADLLADESVIKVVHNAAFERSVFRLRNMEMSNVFDTLTHSRRLRGRDIAGGHTLAALCQRELGRTLDKAEQTSNWRSRPLRATQRDYAALDVEVLVDVFQRFRRELLTA